MTDHTTGLIRPYYFDRQQLTAADLNDEQEYFRERLRRHNRFLHGWGVVSGAGVTGGSQPGLLKVGEGYVVTPHGDEIYIPPGTHVDVSEELDACLGAAADPCTAVKIAAAVINPEGKDLRTDYNAEWVELLVQERMSLDGYIVQHTINPGMPQQAFVDFYTFREARPFPFGSAIRIHSGAARNNPHPAPGVIHRYVAGEHERGNWRLNNTVDTFRILNREGRVLHRRTFASAAARAGAGVTTAYLIVCPCEQPLCARPLLPEACQPPGGAYEWSRKCDIFRLQLVCELPNSHQTALPGCDALHDLVCGGEQAPPPPPLSLQDNGVVLATLSIRDGIITGIDDRAHRRQLLSEQLMLEYLRCQCQVPAPVAAFSGRPAAGQAPLSVAFHNESTGQFTACNWLYGDGASGANCADHAHVYTQPGLYTVSLTVTGPGGSHTWTRPNYIDARRPLSACAREILDRGTLHVAFENTVFAPFHTPASGAGFVPDLVGGLTQQLFSGQVSVETIVMSREQYVVAVAAGNAPDLYVPRNPEPLQGTVDLWTRNYFLDGLRALISPARWAERGGNPNNIADWDNTIVSVPVGDNVTAVTVRAVADAAGVNINIRSQKPEDNPLAMLESGEIQGFCSLWSALLVLVGDQAPAFRVAAPMLFLRQNGQTPGLRPLSMAVRPGCGGLRDELDEGLLAMLGDGRWQILYEKWFPEPPPWTMAQLLDPDLLEPPAAGPGHINVGPIVLIPNLVLEAAGPVEKATGIGRARAKLLRAAGVATLLDFASMPRTQAAEVLKTTEDKAAELQAKTWDVILKRG